MSFVETCEYTFSRHSVPGRGRKSVVTGAAGFIGSHLTDLLLKQGNEVVGLDSFDPASSPDQRAGNLLVAGNSPSFRPRVDDLRTADLVAVFLRQRDRLSPRGRAPGVQDSWGADGPRTWADNVAATQAVLEAALAAGVRRVVLASSSSVYGDTAGHHGKRIMAPTSPYGASKAACEHLAGVLRPPGTRDRDPAVLHRVRAAAASRHGHAPHLRSRPTGLAALRAARQREPDARVHVRPRCGRGHRGGRSRARRRRADTRHWRGHPGLAQRRSSPRWKP